MVLSLSAAACEVESTGDIAADLPPLSERTLYMHYWLEKEEYLTAEPIFIKSQLENAGSETTYYQTLSPAEEIREFVLLDSLKNPIPISRGWGVISSSSAIDTWECLEAHTRTPPGWLYLFFHYGWIASPVDFYLNPGTYYLTHSAVPADTVAFRVVPPSEPVLVAACEELLKSMNDESIYRDTDRLYSFYEEFVARCPNTVYTPRILSNLVSVYAVARHNQSKLQKHAMRLITDFPRSPFLHYALRDLDVRAVPDTTKDSLIESLRTYRETIADIPSSAREVDSVLQVLGVSPNSGKRRRLITGMDLIVPEISSPRERRPRHDPAQRK
jgi:hypothetical protein